ncbi:hypothetical protein, conserved [Babesia ovata]|uniref:Uncharacterized protein n=1 Tax=Babesia ovata TaxID=189622 RepID=A0A2H6KAH4_9APIC|nr:uncharacterized protein BOVATA_014780 [Babesia ovata]GBE59985.1 hypothetical protein, conserved [Babesia ovata]
MSFLHGVLESVKDDDNVTTYDKDGDKITSVISFLNTNVGKGREAFEEAVAQVSEWLKKHGEQVDTLTSGVTTELGGQYYEEVKGRQGLKLQDQMDGWRATLGYIAGDLHNITHNNISELDDTLASQIAHKIEPIQKSVEVLLEAANDATFGEQVNMVDETLINQRQKLEKEIGEKTVTLQKTVDVEWRKVLDSVGALRNAHQIHLQSIHVSLKEGKELLTAFDNTYKLPILKHFDNIRLLVENSHTALTANKMALDRLVSGAELYFWYIKTLLGDKSGEGVLGKYWNGLVEQITQLVTQANGEGSSHNGLKQIKSGVTKYVKTFEEFEKTIRDWVEDIVANNSDGATEFVTWYVNGIQDKLKDEHKSSVETVAKVTEEVKQQITVAMNNIATKAKEQIKTDSTVDENLKSLNAFLENFNGGALKTEVEGIVTLIEKQLKSGAILETEPTNNSDIASAVRTVLNTISTATGKLGKEIDAFAKASNIANLTEAIKNVEKIGEEFKVDLTGKGYGRHIQKTLEDTMKKIKELDPILKQGEGILKSKVNELDAVLSSINDMKKNNTGSIDTNKKETDDKMKELLNDLDNKFNFIYELVRNADQELKTCIRSVSDALATAYKEIEKGVSDLGNELTDEVKKAFKKVTEEIQKMFSEQHKAHLTALHKLVTDQNVAITEIINTDRAAGIKGLMKEIYGGALPIPPSSVTPHPNRLDEMANIAKKTVTRSSQYSKNFTDFSDTLQWYLDAMLWYIQDQLKTPVPNKPSEKRGTVESGKVEKLQHRVDALLNLLKQTSHFNHEFQEKLDNLTDTLSDFHPKQFTNKRNPELLDTLKEGMLRLAEQLKKAYVNVYEGSAPITKWTETLPADQPSQSAPAAPKTKLTTDGEHGAKVCLTSFAILYHGLKTLRQKCDTERDWSNLKVHMKSELGHFLQQCGYTVSGKENQNGHLRNHNDVKGNKIYDLLTGRDKVYNEIHKGSIVYLHRYVGNYYATCHLNIPARVRYPCNVNEMLQWCAGLPHNAMFGKVKQHVKTLFTKPEKRKDEDYAKIDGSELTLPANKNVSARIITDALTDVCTLSHSVLTSILGQGHADGIYACDFLTNPDDLFYPSDTDQCLDMLVEICLRLNEQILFLFKQCQNGPGSSGWRDCWYGKGIAGSAWSCNTMQCPKQDCDQKHNQTCDQKANQNADQHYKCGIKSPLQSFLEDGLQGFLPLTLTKPGCKSTCTVSNHRGIPCKTPMGFGDIGATSSHTKTGAHLRDVLREFCGDSESPLTKLCSLLTCLSQRTPQTLDDLFAFYFCYLYGWNDKDTMRKKHQKDAFDESVKRAYFNKQYDDLDVTPMFKTSSHTPKSAGQKSTHLKGDLFSVHRCDYDGNSEIACGRYLQPMGMNIWNTFSNKNADKYLSWIVYLTETFYDLLKKLYDECCNNCDKPGTRCHDKICPKTCPVKYTDSTADIKTLEGKHHTKDCKSIANCPLTRPTLCKYGFVLQSPHNLSGNDDVNMRRTCKDFCQTLERALDKTEAKAHALAKLVHETIPNFLWKIREPFYFLLLSLWSLSLLYLLHIAVVRLDVLRIRSHLRSPSSHRIAAQSLLAAARVRALANVKYFSP